MDKIKEIDLGLGDAFGYSKDFSSTIKPNRVTDDLLNRLTSQITPKPKQATQIDPEDITSRLQDLQDKLDRIERGSGPINQADDEVNTPENVTAQLLGIVDTFNKALASWYEKSGCVANFGWGYEKNKALEVTSIDFVVFRKKPISDEHVVAAVTKSQSPQSLKK